MATELQFCNSNILIARLSDGTVILASSPYENQGTRRLVKWVKLNLKPRKIVAINTHFHADGTGGNQVYHEEGVETWATRRTARLQMTEGKKILPLILKIRKKPLQVRIRRTRFEPAKNLFDASRGKLFDFSGEKVEVYYPGEAHSPDNVVVYLHSKKILLVGVWLNLNLWDG